MRVSVREARARLSELLDAALRGHEVIIERHGEPMVRLVPVTRRVSLPSRAEFRATLSVARTPAAEVVRALRDDERS